ncbi:MAG TPA: DUF6526 family protein [Terriglobales bacterium]|nr:DUF6526 family protein [Terriglobales bacterium]
MSEKNPQNFANHARFDPLFHFIIVPIFLITWIMTVVTLVRRPALLAAWGVVFMTAAILGLLKARVYALKVQDRVIRLEERLRLTALLPPSAQAGIATLTEAQLIALRFASDAEVPALAERCIHEKLARKDVKQAIQSWRPDYWRV